MFGIVILTVYAVLMIGVTLMFTRKTTDAEGFHVADRRIGSAIAAMSIAATWFWAPPVHFLGDGLYARHPGMFWFYGTECAVPDPVYPLCKKDSGAVPGGHHLDRLHGGALSLRQGQGRLLLPARRAGRSFNGSAAARRGKDAGSHYGAAILEHDTRPGSYRIFLLPLLRAESLYHH